MRVIAVVAAVAGVAVAQSTSINLLQGPPMGVYKTANAQPALTATTLVPAATGTVQKREIKDGILFPDIPEDASVPTRSLNKRADVCVAQPSGIAYSTVPDDPNSFLYDTYYSNAAGNATTPSGYTQSFSNIVAANSADNYLGFTTLTSYDVNTCANQCNSIKGCASFNIYFERDPTLLPDPTSCPNPPSLTRIKCVWWGGLVSLNNANNYGNNQASFYVVVAGSNGYNGNAAAASLSSAAAASLTQTATVATATAADNSVWQIYYSSDSSQGSFTNAQASTSYSDCMTICDNTSGCSAFTYVGGSYGYGSGTCWLKTALGNPTSSGNNYVAAVRISSASSAAASTTAAAVTSAAQSSAVAAQSPAALSSTAIVVAPAAASSDISTSTSSWSLYRPIYATDSSTSTQGAAVVTNVLSAPIANTNTAVSSSITTTVAASVSSAAAQIPASSPSGAQSSSTTVVVPTVANVAQTPASSSSVPQSTTSVVSSVAGVAQKVGGASTSSISTTVVASVTTVPSTTILATSTKASSTTSVTSVASVTSSPAPTTLATSTKASSTTSTSSSTTSSAASSSTPFYLQVGTSDKSSNQYAVVNWLAGGTVTFTPWKLLATPFYTDANGFLIEKNILAILSGFKGSVPATGGAWQKLRFNPLQPGSDPLGCQVDSSGMLECSTQSGFEFAGVCNNDGFLYMGLPAQMPRGCSWVGLYPGN